ncbi:sensor histidine kinase [Actinacidiphila acididurans]|uniref:sensor histidine kinase n=1 Tax=Actinacidiphila acididurans TaxID=2784346 RepID=UPI001F445D56|nr:ATP-binding protein [Actinacidiphila acididurans]
MSAQDSSLAPAPLPSPRRKTSVTRAAALPLAVTVAAGAASAWAATRTTAVHDRPLVLGTGGLAAVLLGVALALALAHRRMSRELRHRTEWLHAEAARTVAAHADAGRRAAAELEAAQRASRDAEVRRRTSVEAEVSLRAALKAETARAAALEGETVRLADVTIPLAVEQLRGGGSADTVLSRLPQPTGPAHQRLLDVLVREIGAGERMRAAGLTACANAASRVQALTTAMLADLREMEERHGEDVLGDLLHLDHCTAQAGRLADSIAVLTGARTGRRWTRPIVMESVLRGAMGRINAYQRVRLHSVSTAAVAGFAAEGVMHALAELMDNACNFSPPTEDVHVYVQETHSGIVITIEDAGLVMPDATLARAEKLVSAEPLDLRSLSGNRLGLAVVGCLARKYGLMVSFRPSSRGGTGVVVLIPPKIVTQAPEGYPVAPVEPVSGGPTAPPRAPVQPAPYVIPVVDEQHDPSTASRTVAGTTQQPRAPYQGPYQGTQGTQGAVPNQGAYQDPYEGSYQGSYQGQESAGSTYDASAGYDFDYDPADYESGGYDGTAYDQQPVHNRPATPLPRRPRGQTLAASRHGDLTGDPAAEFLDPSPEEEARAARARAAAGARFSAFREAAAGRSADRARAAGTDGQAERVDPADPDTEPGTAGTGVTGTAGTEPSTAGTETAEPRGETRAIRGPDFTASGEGPIAGEAWDR